MDNNAWFYDGTNLYHYGVLGMKWGVRRKQRQLQKKRTAALEKARETKSKNAAAKKKRNDLLKKGKLPVSQMTDDEIKAKLDRLNLEKQYRDAVKSKRTSNLGKRFIDNFAESTIDKVAENAFADVVAQAIKVGTTKAVNTALKDELVFTNNKRK